MIALEDWRAGGATFHHRGHEIFVREGGRPDAPALLLLHGFPTASWDFEALWAPLVERFRVIAFDFLGFGLSAKPVGYAYSILDQAELAERLLVDRGVRSYVALAHDYGDTVAQELLARQADPGERPRLERLALLNGGLFPETHRPRLIQKLLLSPIGPAVARLTTRARFDDNLRAIFGPDTPPSAAALEAFWALMNARDGIRVMHRLVRYIPERRQHRSRWVGALTRATIPVRLIAGPEDPISGAHMIARYRELVPRPDVVVLERIGHYPQVEAPERVLAAFLEFVGAPSVG